MARINQAQNTIERSAGGKTSGVFIITDPAVGKVVGVLKPVKPPEIFANKLFALLGMPIPDFDIANKTDFNDTIVQTIAQKASANIAQGKIMMVMKPVEGRSMSEYGVADLKEFFLSDQNLELLGKSMVLDIFTGNSDRIVPFTPNVINPDNIMFQNNCVVFIDQAFHERGTKKESVFSHLAIAMEAEPGTSNDNNRVYGKYILPLVDRALQKYKKVAMSQKNESLIIDNTLEDFTSSIDIYQENRISEIVASGILDGVQLLLENEDKVLELCASDAPDASDTSAAAKALNAAVKARQLDIVTTYAGLKRQSAFFKEEASC